MQDDDEMLSDEMSMLINTLPAILSIREVADFFSVGWMTVYRLVRGEKIEAYKDDEGIWCINRCDLKKFCSENCNL